MYATALLGTAALVPGIRLEGLAATQAAGVGVEDVGCHYGGGAGGVDGVSTLYNRRTVGQELKLLPRPYSPCNPLR